MSPEARVGSLPGLSLPVPSPRCLNAQAESVTFMSTLHLRLSHLRARPGAALLGIAAGLLSLGLPAVRAQDGTPGTNGTPGLTLPGSFTFNDPNASYVGTAGGAGGPAANGGFPFGYNGGTGGTGGTGVIATGANANITILSGTFAGGQGGAGGTGGISSGGINGGSTGGNGGDAFDATGVGTNITILGGTFNAGGGGSVNRGSGGNAGSDFSTTAGETASIYGGNFAFIPIGGNGSAGAFGRNGFAFALNGSSVTVYGTFLTQPGGTPIATPQTFTSSVGSFFGVLADNTGSGQSYIYSIANGGSLTLAPSPVPEASTPVSFGLLLALGLGGMVVAACRKRAS